MITKKEAEDNDYNLSPSRYIDTSQRETYRNIPEILAELEDLEEKSKEADKELKKIFSQIDLPPQKWTQRRVSSRIAS